MPGAYNPERRTSPLFCQRGGDGDTPRTKAPNPAKGERRKAVPTLHREEEAKRDQWKQAEEESIGKEREGDVERTSPPLQSTHEEDHMVFEGGSMAEADSTRTAQSFVWLVTNYELAARLYAYVL